MISQATLDRITPEGCAEYLRQHGWTQDAPHHTGLGHWWKPPVGERSYAIPTDKLPADWLARIGDAIAACAEKAGRCECRIAEDMARLSEGKDPLPSAEAFDQAISEVEYSYRGMEELVAASWLVPALRARAAEIDKEERP